MKKPAYFLLCLWSCCSALAQEAKSFKINKNSDQLMEMVYAFPHELKSEEITEAYMNNELQGTFYALINPRQGDRSLDKYALLKNAKTASFLVKTSWNIEVKRLAENSSNVQIKIEKGIDNNNNTLAASKIKSTGVFEKELENFLNSDFQIIRDSYDSQQDSLAISTDYADYTTTSIPEYSYEEPEKRTSVNLQKIIKKGKTVPFPLSADYFSKKLNQAPTTHDFEAAVGEKYYSWQIDSGLGLLYLKNKNGLEYYSFYTLDHSVITGLPYNLEMNYSSLEWCLNEFKGYLPQWTQVIDDSDESFLQIEFSTPTQFVHLEFYADSKNLKTVLIANKPLN